MPNGISGMTDAGFLAYSVNIKTIVTAQPLVYGTTAEFMTQYGVVHNTYASAYQLCQNPGTKTPDKTEAKRQARRLLEVELRQLIADINATPTVTNEQRKLLGLNVRKQPQPIPRPDQMPILLVTDVVNRTVGLKVEPADSETRGRPPGVASVRVYSFVGEEPPEDLNLWKLQGTPSKTACEAEFPVSVPAFSKVWFTAQWVSPRGATGPACAPVSTFLGSGVVSQSA